MKHPKLLLASLLFFALSGQVLPAAESIPWDTLTPQQQKILRSAKDRWDSFSIEKQRLLEAGASRWQDMTPEQRARARKNLKRWKKMTPDEKRRFINGQLRQSTRHQQ